MTGGAWALAHDHAARAGVELRMLDSLEDAGAIIDVMVATWGREELLPRELIRAFQASGNRPIGAFDGDRPVGYVLGFLGADEQDGVHVHSHMLAVLPERRSAGVGLALKLAQRAAALDIGVPVVRWTFDPLQARNAHFNLVKLGAVADRFRRDYYGEMPDALNRGDRSDRLEARWDLEREPGGTGGGWTMHGPVVLAPQGPSGGPAPVGQPEGDWALIDIPTDYPALKERDPAQAAAWRDAVAEALEACFAAGLTATNFLARHVYSFTRQ